MHTRFITLTLTLYPFYDLDSIFLINKLFSLAKDDSEWDEDNLPSLSADDSEESFDESKKITDLVKISSTPLPVTAVSAKKDIDILVQKSSHRKKSR